MMPTFVQVALGGALGATARYGLGLWAARAFGTGLPIGTLMANVLGSLLMGVFVGAAARFGAHHLNPFVATGLLGGFTTFSSFSLETVRLIEAGQAGRALLYAALSIGVGFTAFWIGLVLLRDVA